VRKRTQKPNLVKKTVWFDGKPRRVYLSVKALRSLDPSLLVNPNKR
jgi:ribosomal protein L28